MVEYEVYVLCMASGDYILAGGQTVVITAGRNCTPYYCLLLLLT